MDVDGDGASRSDRRGLHHDASALGRLLEVLNEGGTRITTPEASTISNGAVSALRSEDVAEGRTISSRKVVESPSATALKRRRHRYGRCGSRPCSSANTRTGLPDRSSASSAARASASVHRGRSKGREHDPRLTSGRERARRNVRVRAPLVLTNVPVGLIDGPIARVTVPFTRVTVPFTRVTVPVTRVTVPVTRVTAPFTRVSVPVTRVTAPFTRVTVPVTRVTVPVTRVTVPVTRVTAPFTRVTVPFTRVTAPFTRVTVPFTRVTVPFTRVTVPVTRVTVPVTRVTVPVTRVTVPFTRVTVPFTRVTVPFTRVTAPFTRVTAPFTRTTAPSARPDGAVNLPHGAIVKPRVQGQDIADTPAARRHELLLASLCPPSRPVEAAAPTNVDSFPGDHLQMGGRAGNYLLSTALAREPVGLREIDDRVWRRPRPRRRRRQSSRPRPRPRQSDCRVPRKMASVRAAQTSRGCAWPRPFQRQW
jgi:hypothetical protein